MKKLLAAFCSMCVILAAAGCSRSEKTNSTGGMNTIEEIAPDVASPLGSSGKGELCDASAPEYAVGEPYDTDAPLGVAPPDGKPSEGEFGVGGEITAAPSGDGIVVPGQEVPSKKPEAGILTAGEWNDNEHWSYWKELYNTHDDWKEYKNEWRITLTERLCVTVTANGAPLEGAKIVTDGFSAVTDNKGKAYIFYSPDNFPKTVNITYGTTEKTVETNVQTDASDLAIELEISEPTLKKSLDLMIMCDTTGSMSDELEYLKAELVDIVSRIQAENPNITPRVSVNFYRDDGDEYVVKNFDFTENIEDAAGYIIAQHADGGGDFPEAVDRALESALKQNWQSTTKIMFLVLDAPPHNKPKVVDKINSLVKETAEQGIRIIPVASSGIDKSTEYILRNFAFQTGGTYTFLTSDSGVGGEHITPTVGAYNVEKLGDLMVRLAKSYLS